MTEELKEQAKLCDDAHELSEFITKYKVNSLTHPEVLRWLYEESASRPLNKNTINYLKGLNDAELEDTLNNLKDYLKLFDNEKTKLTINGVKFREIDESLLNGKYYENVLTVYDELYIRKQIEYIDNLI